MPIEISPFEPSSASDLDFTEHYAVMRSVMGLDHPDQPLPTIEEYVKLLCEPATATGPISRWVVRDDGRIVGTASAKYPMHENRHVTVARVTVSPARRCQGIGAAALRAILPDLGADRTVVVANGVKGDASGEKWARGLGFVRTQAKVRQMLALAEVDPVLWQRPVPEGFQLESWIGAAPEELLEEYARARTAILDAPQGDSTLEMADWTSERVRKHEEDLRSRGIQNRVTVAIEQSSSRIAGITELELLPSQPSQAMQRDTAVAADFRGLGLGLAIKGAMLRWLTADRPAIAEVFTHTAHDNISMIRINHALGYITTAVVAELRIALAELARRLESR
ncbi:GNAT family N-acetyltransferase [Catenulispora pinisilvae]|uniref:GNAT family N-acetyltransferase n=1 Tax=Catenulispora pinisilvae TaxID=2705253 RepID=UPI0018912233|nr:GNAT family N-acetyltransferase [Catenulispora pinisilvae]